MPIDHSHKTVDDPIRLKALREVALLDTPAEEAFDRLTRLAVRFTKAPVALVTLIDADRQFFKSSIGLPEPWNTRRETPLSFSFCRHNRVAGKPLVISDAREHPEFRDHPAIGEFSVIAYLGFPLVSPDSYVLGSFCAIDSKPRIWTEEEIEVVRDLAGAVMDEIDLRTQIAQRKKIEKERNELTGLFISLKEESEARKRAEENLRASEKRFRDLVEMLPVAVFETDQNFHLSFANRHAFEIFGYQPEDLKAGIHSVDLVAPEEKPKARANISKRLKGENLGMVEYIASRKDGATFPILLLAAPLWIEDRFAGLRGIILDITDRKRDEEEKLKIADQFRQAQKMESIGRLAGGVSHDLNNLLSPIIGYCELLLHGFEPNDRRHKSIRQILQAGLRAKDLVHQLLAFSRKQNLEYKPADLNKVLTGFETLLRRTIREDIHIDIQTTPENPMILADVGQIEQVIMNLCVNAQDAMPKGGTLRFKTGIIDLMGFELRKFPDAAPGKCAVLTVSDTGSGMDEDTQKHLFEPFFSTKGEKGTGLGLATVYGIIKQHCGNIEVFSTPGKGTTFQIYLPFNENAGSIPESKAVKPTDFKGTETILIVEDDDQVLQVAKEILQRQGYRILSADNGPSALRILETYGKPVHLLLTDLVMPQMNGKALFEKASVKYPNLKVLYMSGYHDDVTEPHGMSEKGVVFIQKPLSAETLSVKVREILNAQMNPLKE